MELLTGAFRIFLLYIIFTNIIRIIFALINRKKIAERLEEVRNSEVAQTAQVEEIEYVTDPICDCKVDKDNAYIILEEDEKKYFCSWDCRQEYIDKKN
jgi:YHS domain-containing protein